MKARMLVTLFVVTVVTPSTLSAQTLQTRGYMVSGIVRDQLGLTMSGVEVAIHGITVPDARKVKTDEKGYYEFAELPPGQYVIRTSRPGFRVSPSPVVIEAADVSHDIGLLIGSVTETIEVVGFEAGAIAPRSGSGKHRKPPRC